MNYTLLGNVLLATGILYSQQDQWVYTLQDSQYTRLPLTPMVAPSGATAVQCFAQENFGI